MSPAGQATARPNAGRRIAGGAKTCSGNTRFSPGRGLPATPGAITRIHPARRPRDCAPLTAADDACASRRMGVAACTGIPRAPGNVCGPEGEPLFQLYRRPRREDSHVSVSRAGSSAREAGSGYGFSVLPRHREAGR